VLALIKSLSAGHFRNDALKWAGPSIDKSNLVTPGQLQRILQPVFLLNLIEPEKLLTKESRKILDSQKGSIVLVSDDPGLSARTWMLLSQMGYRNLFILADSTDNEVFKYKFRPDTVTGPEL
jgi:hypothetical protein